MGERSATIDMVVFVDIQSVAAEIRRGIKKIDRRRRKKPQGKNIMSASATQGGHNKCTLNSIITRHNTNTGTQKHLWANAQRDGLAAEHRWRPLFNAAKLADAHY